jgi:hypothetical protein
MTVARCDLLPGHTAAAGQSIPGGALMNSIRIYPGREGWFYEVWIASRLVIFGWAPSRERAEWQASTI